MYNNYIVAVILKLSIRACLYFRVLVGAPKANYTKQTTGVINPGKLYKCTFNISSSSQSCSPINYILDGLLGSDEFGKWTSLQNSCLVLESVTVINTEV